MVTEYATLARKLSNIFIKVSCQKIRFQPEKFEKNKKSKITSNLDSEFLITNYEQLNLLLSSFSRKINFTIDKTRAWAIENLNIKKFLISADDR